MGLLSEIAGKAIETTGISQALSPTDRALRLIYLIETDAYGRKPK